MSATSEGRTASFLCRLGFHRPIGYLTFAFTRYAVCHSCGKRLPR